MVNKISIGWSLRGLLLEGRLIDRRFRRRWKNYLFQCGLSTLALLIIFLVVDVVLQGRDRRCNCVHGLYRLRDTTQRRIESPASSWWPGRRGNCWYDVLRAVSATCIRRTGRGVSHCQGYLRHDIGRPEYLAHGRDEYRAPSRRGHGPRPRRRRMDPFGGPVCTARSGYALRRAYAPASAIDQLTLALRGRCRTEYPCGRRHSICDPPNSRKSRTGGGRGGWRGRSIDELAVESP